ncbi:MAG TPA: 2-oxoglutarate ferredoxin oxidoreductase subunit alpha, partial [Dermatophilaceae bacterium]|nr:2-oxoglutarate ferredoxin oxidoreductase subunit alpha [Dermatophilaceae bacterium]
VPGTAGLEHRIGGIEKADVTGNISYDPDNHQRMTDLRQGKVDGITVPDLVVDDPSGSARVLVLGWGSTYGPVHAAANNLRREGRAIARIHLRHLNPLPANLGEILRAYDRVVLPEMNGGQLALLLRGTYLVDIQPYTSVRGLPFTPAQLARVFADAIDSLDQESSK